MVGVQCESKHLRAKEGEGERKGEHGKGDVMRGGTPREAGGLRGPRGGPCCGRVGGPPIVSGWGPLAPEAVRDNGTD